MPEANRIIHRDIKPFPLLVQGVVGILLARVHCKAAEPLDRFEAQIEASGLWPCSGLHGPALKPEPVIWDPLRPFSDAQVPIPKYTHEAGTRGDRRPGPTIGCLAKVVTVWYRAPEILLGSASSSGFNESPNELSLAQSRHGGPITRLMSLRPGQNEENLWQRMRALLHRAYQRSSFACSDSSCSNPCSSTEQSGRLRVATQGAYSIAVDMWAVGCVFAEMATGMGPTLFDNF